MMAIRKIATSNINIYTAFMLPDSWETAGNMPSKIAGKTDLADTFWI